MVQHQTDNQSWHTSQPFHWKKSEHDFSLCNILCLHKGSFHSVGDFSPFALILSHVTDFVPQATEKSGIFHGTEGKIWSQVQDSWAGAGWQGQAKMGAGQEQARSACSYIKKFKKKFCLPTQKTGIFHKIFSREGTWLFPLLTCYCQRKNPANGSGRTGYITISGAAAAVTERGSTVLDQWGRSDPAQQMQWRTAKANISLNAEKTWQLWLVDIVRTDWLLVSVLPKFQNCCQPKLQQEEE